MGLCKIFSVMISNLKQTYGLGKKCPAFTFAIKYKIFSYSKQFHRAHRKKKNKGSIFEAIRAERSMEIMGKEMIKPWCPTPHDLRSHKLCFLDQIAPPIYTPLIFFYQQQHDDDAQIKVVVLRMKESLSKALTQFYPLAGRMRSSDDEQGSVIIDCNDAGALFIETRVHGHVLQEVVDSPKMEQLREYLLPKITTTSWSEKEKEEEENNNILLAVQINIFDCKGIAVGVKMSHKIADGTSLVTFVNAWAEICRGEEEITIFKQSIMMSFGNLFPPRDLTSLGFRANAGIIMNDGKDKIVTKRVIFSKEKLAKLKELCAPCISNPTRVEVVSAFIWKQFIEMQQKHRNKEIMVAAVHAVNLRPRMDPPLPDHAFGNIWRHTLAPMPKEDSGNQYYQSLVRELRTSINNTNSNYVMEKLVQNNGDEYIQNIKDLAELFLKGEIELCNFSSWCRFPVYEVDFGWGKPLWVCTTTLPFKNVAIFMSTKNGDGIEVWINMLQDDASFLEPALHSNIN